MFDISHALDDTDLRAAITDAPTKDTVERLITEIRRLRQELKDRPRHGFVCSGCRMETEDDEW